MHKNGTGGEFQIEDISVGEGESTSRHLATGFEIMEPDNIWNRYITRRERRACRCLG